MDNIRNLSGCGAFTNTEQSRDNPSKKTKKNSIEDRTSKGSSEIFSSTTSVTFPEQAEPRRSIRLSVKQQKRETSRTEETEEVDVVDRSKFSNKPVTRKRKRKDPTTKKQCLMQLALHLLNEEELPENNKRIEKFITKNDSFLLIPAESEEEKEEHFMEPSVKTNPLSLQTSHNVSRFTENFSPFAKPVVDLSKSDDDSDEYAKFIVNGTDLDSIKLMNQVKKAAENNGLNEILDRPLQPQISSNPLAAPSGLGLNVLSADEVALLERHLNSFEKKV